MKNIFVAILFLSAIFGFAQNKTAVKNVANEKPVATPVKVDANKESLNAKGDVEVAVQNDTDYSQIFTSVQVNAVPPGGLNAYRMYISKTFKTPEVEENVTAKVFLKFVVFEDGSLHDFLVIKETPSGLGLGQEAIRVFKAAGNWTPGQMNGKIVKQYYTFPIMIEMLGSGKEPVAI